MSTRSISLGIIFVLSLLLAFLQHIAFENFFYWKFWWYDLMMHFLGGTVLGSVFFWTVQFEFSGTLKNKLSTFASVFLFVLAVGLLWEVFEYSIGIDREYSRIFWEFDSLQDLCMDVLGGSVAYWGLKRIIPTHG